MSQYPAVLQAAYENYLNEQNYNVKLKRIIDCFEAFIKFILILAIQEFYKNQEVVEKHREVDIEIRSVLNSVKWLGSWITVLKKTIDCYQDIDDNSVIKELYLFVYKSISLIPEYNNLFEPHGIINKLINFRNEYSHGPTVEPIKADDLSKKYGQLLQEFLDQAKFLKKFELIIQDNDIEEVILYDRKNGYHLRNEIIFNSNHDWRVKLRRKKTNAVIELSPLFLIEKRKVNKDNKPRRINIFMFNSLIMENDKRKLDFVDHFDGEKIRIESGEYFSEFLKKFSPLKKYEANWFYSMIESEAVQLMCGKRAFQDLEVFTNPDSPNINKVLFVIGKPGIGKTTLLARFADQWGCVRHFFMEENALFCDLEFFYKNLCQQLIDRYQLKNINYDRSNLSSLKQQFLSTLGEVAKRHEDETIPIIIDGVDELLRAQSSDKSKQQVLTWLLSPNELPNNVRLIYATRGELLEEKVVKKQFKTNKIEKVTLDGLNEQEINSYFELHYPESPLKKNRKFIAQITEKSEGNPLYLYYLVNQLKKEQITLADIQGLPDGLSNYLEDLLNTICNEAQKQNLEGPIVFETLALFCLIKEPVNFDFVLNALKYDPIQIGKVKDLLAPYLKEARNHKFVVYHTAFREYFLNQSPDDGYNSYQGYISQTKNKLLNWCSNWQNNLDESKYALKYYLDHLIEFGQEEKVFSLIKDKQETSKYLTTQENELKDGLYYLFNSIQKVLDIAIQYKDAKRIIEYMELYIFTKELHTLESPLVPLQAGNLSQTLAYADIYPEDKALFWYLIIIYSLIRQNRIQEAQETLKKWTAKNVRPEIVLEQERGYFLFLYEQIKPALFPENIRELWLLQPGSDLELFDFFINNQKWEEVLDLIPYVVDKAWQDDLYHWVAVYQTTQSFYTEADKTADLITFPVVRAKTKKLLSERKKIQEIRKQNPTNGVNNLLEQYVQKNDLHTIIRIIQFSIKFESTFHKIIEITNWVYPFLEDNQIDTVLNCINELDEDEGKFSLLKIVVQYLFQNGDLEQGLQLLTKYMDHQGRLGKADEAFPNPGDLHDWLVISDFNNAVDEKLIKPELMGGLPRFTSVELMIKFLPAFEALFDHEINIAILKINGVTGVDSQDRYFDFIYQKYFLGLLSIAPEMGYDVSVDDIDEHLKQINWVKAVLYPRQPQKSQDKETKHKILFQDIVDYFSKINPDSSFSNECLQQAFINIAVQSAYRGVENKQLDLLLKKIPDKSLTGAVFYAKAKYFVNNSQHLNAYDLLTFEDAKHYRRKILDMIFVYLEEKADWMEIRRLSGKEECWEQNYEANLYLGQQAFLANKADWQKFFNDAFNAILSLTYNRLFNVDTWPDNNDSRSTFLNQNFLEMFPFIKNLYVVEGFPDIIELFVRQLDQIRNDKFNLIKPFLFLKFAEYYINLENNQEAQELISRMQKIDDLVDRKCIRFYTDLVLFRAYLFTLLDQNKQSASDLNHAIVRLTKEVENETALNNLKIFKNDDDIPFNTERLENYRKHITLNLNVQNPLLDEFQDQQQYEEANFIENSIFEHWTFPDINHGDLLSEISEWFENELTYYSKWDELWDDFEFNVKYVISNLVTFWAQRGEFDLARQIGFVLTSPTLRSEFLVIICNQMIEQEQYAQLADYLTQIWSRRQERLAEIMKKLINQDTKAAHQVFLDLIPLWTKYRSLTYLASGYLANVFPDQLFSVFDTLTNNADNLEMALSYIKDISPLHLFD